MRSIRPPWPEALLCPACWIFSADETTDIGDDYGPPVSADHAGASTFTGRIDVVQIDIGDDDHSHLIQPAEVARIATAGQ